MDSKSEGSPSQRSQADQSQAEKQSSQMKPIDFFDLDNPLSSSSQAEDHRQLLKEKMSQIMESMPQSMPLFNQQFSLKPDM